MIRLKSPAKFSAEYLECLDSLNQQYNTTGVINETYGALPASVIGNTRPSVLLPKVSLYQLESYITKSESFGIGFNYTMNSVWHMGIESSQEGRKKIREEIQALANSGVTQVTIASPYLIQSVHHFFPALDITASINLCTSTIQEIKQLQKFNVRKVVLNRHMNRDFSLLEYIRQQTTVTIELLLNSLCQLFCHMHQYHNVVNSCASNVYGSRDSLPIFPEIQCIMDYLEEPGRIICAGWIRPEDTHCYQGVGISDFKLEGRVGTTEEVLKIAEIYLRQKHEGNFIELFHHYFNSPEIKKKLGIYLENQVLEGFIKPFVEGKMNCRTCSGSHAHCERYKKMISLDNSNREALLDKYKKELLLSLQA